MDLICFQTEIAWEDRQTNFARIEAMVDGAAVAPGSVLAFPEMCVAGFTMNVGTVGESEAGESVAFFSDLSRRLACHLIAGIPTVDSAGSGWNEAVCFDTGGQIVGRYRKVHLFPLAGEGAHYQPGSGPLVIECGGWRVAPFICYDLRFPELFRHATRAGAEVLVVIANWPAIREDHWITLLRARAIENQAYVAGVNRCGTDPNIDYSGASLIVSPKGEVLARAGSLPEVLGNSLNRDEFDDWRSRFPALADMRLI